MPKKPNGTRKGTPGPEDRAAPPDRPEQGDPIQFEILVPGPSWASSWRAFVQENGSWWDRVGGAGPVYALPTEVIESLAKGTEAIGSNHYSSKPLLSLQDAEAERDFLLVCKGCQSTIVGVWDEKPIPYQLLTEPAISPIPQDWQLSASGLVEDGSLRETKRRLEKLRDELSGIHRQMLGYVGWLTFNPQYRSERAALQARWANLPNRPSLPIDANVADQPPVPVGSIGPYRERVLGDELAQVLIDIGKFLRRWRINRLVTWHLPEPQGPLDQIPLAMAVSILGPDQRVDFIPSYYDIPSSGDVRKVIRRRQGQAAADDGIEQAHPVTDTSARDGRASRYEAAFRLWLIERSIRRRYGSPRGLVARLLPVFADLTDVSEYRVQQLRQLYREALDAEG